MRALLTGANSLVNKHILDRLVKDGYKVTAHYHTENDLTKELTSEYLNVHFIQADFSHKDGFMKFINEAMGSEKYDVVITGAVYYAEADDWTAQLEWDEWQKTFAINTTANGVLMAHANLVVNEGGVMVNISSIAAKPNVVETQFAMYRASKAAIDSMICSYAKMWAPNIRVVGVGPGWIKSSWNKDMDKKELKKMLDSQKQAKLVDPEEIADLIMTVIRIKSINATTLMIDGGLGAPEI